MNDRERPLSPDVVDELLSAEIDGELDRAAADLGLTLGEARAALDTAPDVAARHAALIRARDLLATSSPLDAGRETRLVTAALDRFTEERRDASRLRTRRLEKHRFANSWRVLVAVGSTAAVVAGVVVLAATNPGPESKRSTASATTAAVPVRTVAPGKATLDISFGDVTQPPSLLARVRAELNAPAAATTPSSRSTKSAANPPSGNGSTGGYSAQNQERVLGPDATSSAGSAHSDSTLQSCIAAREREVQRQSALVLAGTGTDAGRPVVVVVFRSAIAYIVYVLDATSCSVVARETLP